MHQQGKRRQLSEEGVDMTGDDGREVFEAILPQEEINRLGVDCGVIAPQRKMNLGRLVRAMVIAAGTPGGAYQADILRSSLEYEVPQVARSAFYFSPAREHDRRHLTIDESWRGCGLLADLAYASLARLQACNDHGVRCVIRLKDTWTPTVDLMARGEVTQEFLPGTDLDVLLEEELLVRDGRAIDADVHVGAPKHP
jgi:hypothetical protein